MFAKRYKNVAPFLRAASRRDRWFSGRGDKRAFTSAERVQQVDWTINSYGTVVVRLVGGPADGLVFVMPQDNLPKFAGVGYPVSKYVPQPGNGEVRVFHYVALH